ncbi:MAG: carboxylesterase family protein [Bacteroidales bacterium]
MKTKLASFGFPVFLASLLLSLASCTTKSHLIDPVVTTAAGQVEGLPNAEGTVTSFKGIPYAAPPVGEFRWKEPQPPLPWEGVRDASEFCASCIQVKQGSRLPWSEEFMVQNDISEDCLFLNIWTPAETADDKLAVLVYIHGGGFVEGSGAIVTYDGEELAKKGIVVVTINYRLGVLGFLVHPELTAESPNQAAGNYGLLDQIAALHWIRENIAAFGGDPGRVTIAGQSAGAMSVQALTASPLAKGLFHGAITQSGTSYRGFSLMTTMEEAERRGLEYAGAKGVDGLAGLRGLSAEEILKPVEGQAGMGRFSTVIDGYVLTDDYRSVFAQGKQNDTPFLTGMNRDELRYGGERSDEFYQLYLPEADGDTALALKAAGQEYSRLNACLWLEHRAVTAHTKGYVYYFDQAIPWPEHPEFGAFHTGEVPYVFQTLKALDRPWTETDTLVADRMSSYWANFAKTGDPNAEGLPVWNAFDGNTWEVMELGADMGMIPVASSETRLNFLREQLLATE